MCSYNSLILSTVSWTSNYYKLCFNYISKISAAADYQFIPYSIE